MKTLLLNVFILFVFPLSVSAQNFNGGGLNQLNRPIMPRQVMPWEQQRPSQFEQLGQGRGGFQNFGGNRGGFGQRGGGMGGNQGFGQPRGFGMQQRGGGMGMGMGRGGAGAWGSRGGGAGMQNLYPTVPEPGNRARGGMRGRAAPPAMRMPPPQGVQIY